MQVRILEMAFGVEQQTGKSEMGSCSTVKSQELQTPQEWRLFVILKCSWLWRRWYGMLFRVDCLEWGLTAVPVNLSLHFLAVSGCLASCDRQLVLAPWLQGWWVRHPGALLHQWVRSAGCGPLKLSCSSRAQHTGRSSGTISSSSHSRNS